MTNNENELMPCPVKVLKNVIWQSTERYDCETIDEHNDLILKLFEQEYTRPQPSADVSEALDRILSDAYLGISSGDYEIMNREGYDKGMCQHYKDAETIRQALTQPKAVDVDELKGIVSRACWSATERTSPQTVDDAMECVKYWFSELLNEQGYLNTNERVQELEACLKRTGEALVETDKHRDDLLQKLKVATVALEVALKNAKPYCSQSSLYDEGEVYNQALQQINGGRDE